MLPIMATICTLLNLIVMHLGSITGYKVIIVTNDGPEPPITVGLQLSVVLVRPDGAFSVQVLAINSAGEGQTEEAEPVGGMFTML